MKLLMFLLAIMVGVALMAHGAYLMTLEMRATNQHALHVIVSCGELITGLLLSFPHRFLAGLKAAVAIVGPYLPIKKKDV